jgi:hypothetical protein
VKEAMKRTLLLAFISLCGLCPAQTADRFPPVVEPPHYGPYNAVFLSDGDGLRKPLQKDDPVLRADSPWTLLAWVRPSEAVKVPQLLAGVGDPTEEFPRYLAADDGKLMLWMGKDNVLSGSASINPGEWHLVAASFDGTAFSLYLDGNLTASGKLELGSVSPVLNIAPPAPLGTTWKHYGGRIAGLELLHRSVTADEIKQLAHLDDYGNRFESVVSEEGSKPWPVQTRGQAGYRAPQDPATMPRSRQPFSKPVVNPAGRPQDALQPAGANVWTIASGWKLADAAVPGTGAEISQAGFGTGRKINPWLPATVPGTVLTTLIDQGIYPDPDYGLNNLAIPESLNKGDHWYRVEFRAPKTTHRRMTLTFEGINYAAEAWLNGKQMGRIKGAFIRGRFDVTGILKADGLNALAVRVSPPPHPGIPHEQSIKGGPGENGGIMVLDGPTFMATEGWDWIPAIRDRNTGIWQPVTLAATDDVKIGDVHVVTSLPLPDTSRADLDITVPLENASASPVGGTLKAQFGDVTVTKQVTAVSGKSSVTLSPQEFRQLTVQHPRLWWPNGYGKQELYTLNVSFAANGSESDRKQVRFGIREITYEMSLLDGTGHLRRVEYSPTTAAKKGELVVNTSHDGIRQIPAAEPMPADFPADWREWWKSWVFSFTPGGEQSSSVRPLDDARPAPYLVVKVNGVRIACRGGSWGMDDSRKRVSRERLEPYFRLHHDANLNIIRNWMGQDTEEVFFDLADEYGLLVWNDFWLTTQDYNLEPEDPQLLLENARDTISRFVNHPSILAWCGRNEGVPQPIVNQELAELIRTIDGTRYYFPSSNQIGLQQSGPYKYMDPKLYYTTLNRGFSVETGTPSFSTLEAFKASIPPTDQWPISDAWAYHDWHQSGNGDMGPFMAQMQAQFGAPTSLEDFERKAQMLDYVDHRAIFEGMNAHLFTPNSGRMLWMTQPAWPSNTWQILSSDYDTQSSFYGVKKACEPLHVQLDLSDYNVAVVNTTAANRSGLTVTAELYSLANRPLLRKQEKKDAPANTEVDAFRLELGPLLSGESVVLVKLRLEDTSGALVSENFYWIGEDAQSYRKLNRLAAASLVMEAKSARSGETARITVNIRNASDSPALQAKLTLLNSDGSRILPAYYSDNYISLLPGETRKIEIEYPTRSASGTPQIALRGWNVEAKTVEVR